MTESPDISRLVLEQRRIVTREQLAAADVSDKQIGSRTRQRGWRTIGPHVVALQNGPLDWAQRCWAAVLHAGPESLLCLSTAAQAGGLRGFESRIVHVAVEHGRELPDVTLREGAIRVHQTRHLDQDVVRTSGPPRQALPRSVVEMAAGCDVDGKVRAVIAGSVQQGLVRPEQLHAFVERRPTLPNRRLIRETIDDVAGGAHSLPELAYVRGLARAGLPKPTRQRRVQHQSGSWYLDVAFETWQVVVEINGSQHYELLAREADDVRRTALQLDGSLVLEISSYLVRHRIRVAVLRTAEALEHRGWEPTPRTRSILDGWAVAESWTSPRLRHPA